MREAWSNELSAWTGKIVCVVTGAEQWVAQMYEQSSWIESFGSIACAILTKPREQSSETLARQ